jgi:hypothetical protein
MEGNNQETRANRLPTPATAAAEAATLDIIRTETVLSRLPVHNLAKKGSIKISIIKKTDTGEVELLWNVSPSRDYGEPRQLAYKLDTIVINQRIDEAGRPLPKILRLGSLGEICTELGVAQQGGKSKNEVKKAFFQNVGALINAKFNYRANDGSERRLEAVFTRYSIIFTGEKLPDGRKADAVYIIFNEPFWEVLNNAPVRPLDRAYMKELPPGAQRFYEIVSRKVFAALRNNYLHAKISYSEYCTYSAQLRHLERQPVQDQMAKVLRPHKESGYITKVRYEPTIDAESKPDWILHLTPGPRAFAEYDAAHGRRKKLPTIMDSLVEVGERQLKHQRRGRGRSAQLEPATPVEPAHDPQLIAEFTRRGITEKKTLEILAKVKPGQDVVAQLELGDRMVQVARVPIVNPPGFLINLIESNMSVPESFETSAKRKAREENERKERERRAEEDARQLLEWEYDDYCQREGDRLIEENPAAFEAMKEAKRTENHAQHPGFSSDFIESIAENEARRAMRKQATILTLEEFVQQKQSNPDFLLKPVALLASAPVVSDAPLTAGTDEREDIVMTDDAVILPDQAAVTGDRGEETYPAADPAMEPATPVAGIDSEPESAKAEPAPIAVIEPGPSPDLTNSAPANAEPDPNPPIGAPTEGLEQGMGEGLESSPYPPELPHGSQAA